MLVSLLLLSYAHTWCLLVVPRRISCPSPPAPEGWDKDITQQHEPNTAIIILNSTKPSTLYAHHLIHSPISITLCNLEERYLMHYRSVLAVDLVPRPPAPEGWDKDHTQINCTPLHPHSRRLGKISTLSLFSIPSCPLHSSCYSSL